MKKTLAVLGVGLVLAANVMAQGSVNFANGAAGINQAVKVPGTAANAAAADSVFADIYYGATAGTATTPLALKVQVGTISAGYFSGLSPGNVNGGVTIPGTTIGGSVFVKIVAWQGGDTYANATISKIESAVVQVNNLGGGAVPAPAIPLGTGTLTLVPIVPIPEPSTIALSVLGLGGLLLFRRRK